MDTVGLLPLQGEFTHLLVPRAMPWAKCVLAFQAISTQVLHYLRNLNKSCFTLKMKSEDDSSDDLLSVVNVEAFPTGLRERGG